MGKETAIAWTDATWNPVRGCSRVSSGCINCYAERVAARFSGPGLPYEGLAKMTVTGPRWTGEVRLVMKHLKDPVRWKEPRRIFVNSMSDLFHEKLSSIDISLVWRAMRAAPHHTFQILTKRPERMREWVQAWVDQGGEVLPHVWLGVSVEDQATADARIPLLLRTAAAVRFLSCEPLLGKLNLSRYMRCHQGGPYTCGNRPGECCECAQGRTSNNHVDWVIVGGESGPDARECRASWIRSIVAQCRLSSTPVFVKQLGAHIIDRNDAGFDGHDPENWPEGTETDDWDLDPGRQYQGADARILLADSKGADPAEWPQDLRVQQFPEATV